MDFDTVEAGPELDNAVAEAGPELDNAVAEAVGIKAVPGAIGKTFRPSEDWNDAMEAAEKVGLFDDCELGTIAGENREWEVSRWEAREHDTISLWHFVSATTGPVAICRAILKTKKPLCV